MAFGALQFGAVRHGAFGAFGQDRLGGGGGVSPNARFIGVTYNTTTDSFVRLGAASPLAVRTFAGPGYNPILPFMRLVALADNGAVYKQISWLDRTKYVDGTTVAQDGTQGQIMLGIRPIYYYAAVDGANYTLSYSPYALPGYTLHPLFTEMSEVFYGLYEGSVYSYSGTNKLCSISKSPADGTTDVYPVTTRSGDWGYGSLTTAATDTIAAARGAGWQQADLLMELFLRDLLIITFGSYDIPGVVGDGRINLSGGTWTNGSYIGKCGLSLASQAFYGAVQNGTTAGYATDYSHVFGIENLWGNVWTRVASLVNSGAVYYNPSAASPSYNYATTTGWTRLLDAGGTGITLPTSSGYGGVPHTGTGLCIPADVTGSSSTKMRDSYAYDSGLRVLIAGGSSNDGAGAGPFDWGAFTAASFTFSGVGGRLTYKQAA
ncbi:MAG: hypothetical protein HGA87_00755 [Desulfobulbaceae bacterium]|nr:hypothetical protein [Desulfobulbaceae bacterium]